MIKISIIIPVYKVEKYLRQCVESVINQTYKNIEIILVDDGSPDRCPTICDEYAKQDDRIIVIHKGNGGLSDARNSGIKIASGDYALFLDSDDYWTDLQALQKLVNRHSIFPVDVLNYGYYVKDETTGKQENRVLASESMPQDKKRIDEQLSYIMGQNLYIASACNKLISMPLLKEQRFEVGRVSEDIEWAARILNKSKSMDYMNIGFYCYRQRNDSITHSISEKSCSDLTYAITKCCDYISDSGEEKKQAIRQYTAYQFATFIAVQAFAPKFQKQCIQTLKQYKDVLKYNQSSNKVKVMYLGTRLFGLTNWCRLIRITKPIWNSRRI